MAQTQTRTKKIFRPEWILFGVSALLTVVAIVMLILLFTQRGAVLRDAAFSAGQQARINLKTGEVEGNLVVLEKPEETNSETPESSVAETPAQETPAPEGERPSAETMPESPVAETPTQEASVPEGEQQTAPDAEQTKPAAETLAPPKVSVPLRGSLNPSLYENVEKLGKLPIISDSGQESWKYYGKPDISAPGQPVIAIMVTGLGLNRATTAKALALPEFVSLSFSPYAGQLQQQLTQARTYGHEVWLDLPLQPQDYPASDAGPLSLFKDTEDDKTLSLLHKLLASTTTYVGFVGTANDAVSDYAPIHTVAMELKKRGVLLMLRSNRYVNPETQDRMLYVSRAVDAMAAGASPNAAQILVELEATAKEYGYAIGVLADAPQLFEEITTWSQTLPTKGIALVPATAIVERQK